MRAYIAKEKGGAAGAGRGHWPASFDASDRSAERSRTRVPSRSKLPSSTLCRFVLRLRRQSALCSSNYRFIKLFAGWVGGAKNMNSRAGSPLPLLRDVHQPVVSIREQRARASRACCRYFAGTSEWTVRERWFLITRMRWQVTGGIAEALPPQDPSPWTPVKQSRARASAGAWRTL